VKEVRRGTVRSEWLGSLLASREVGRGTGLGRVGLERPVYGDRRVGELARRRARCSGDYRRSVAGERVWASGRARPRVRASYRAGFGHGHRVEHAAEPTDAHDVRCAVRASPGQVEHVEDGVCPSSSIRLAALECLSQRGFCVGSLPCTKILPFCVSSNTRYTSG
jgi:hypothetical protein